MARQYKDAGVDVEKTDRLVDEISGLVDGIGGFGGVFPLDDKYLVSGTDGVGTKLVLANRENKLEGVGIDCVAMCVNDIICTGAKPLFFLDYYASSKIIEDTYKTVIESIKKGCDIAGIPLIGGETAELPGVLEVIAKPFTRKDATTDWRYEFDIAGFSVGIVDKDKFIDGSKIEKGDTVIGIASNGLHSNGYSLARKLWDYAPDYNNDEERSVSVMKNHPEYSNLLDNLLKPTEIYVDTILQLVEKFDVHGIAHITGGGRSNIDRILPSGLTMNWNDVNPIPRPRIFEAIQKFGAMSDDEMNSVFNNGIGMCVILKKEDVIGAWHLIKSTNRESWVVGTIE